jgi:hypothetical protein
MVRHVLPLSFLAILSLTGARAAHASLVVLDDGRVIKVRSFDGGEEAARLTLLSGVTMTLPIERIERVVDDEIEIVPDPPPAVALAALDTVPAPQLLLPLHFEESQSVPEGPYGSLIFEKAKLHKVNPRIVAALIRAESSGNSRAVSHKGARGLMQLMPATAERFGVERKTLMDPKSNLEAGVKYLAWLIEQFPNDLARVLAAYNAGEQAVWRYNGIPPYRETQGYVRRIYSTLGLSLSPTLLAAK